MNSIGIILAGGLQASPLCVALHRNVVTLPLRNHATVLDGWIDSLVLGARCDRVCVLVSSVEDRVQVQTLLRRSAGEEREPPVDVVTDPRPWRGTAGVIRDVLLGYDAETAIVGEGVCLPPVDLEPLLAALDGTTTAAVGVGLADEPAGLYAFACSVFDAVPEDGFFDLKEQMLPLLHADDAAARPVPMGGATIRLRDRPAYLEAIAAMSTRAPSGTPTSPGDTTILGHSVVDRTSHVEPGALVYDSVVMEGARVRSGAVVCRSIVARSEVGPDEDLRDAVRAKPGLVAGTARTDPPETHTREDVLC